MTRLPKLSFYPILFLSIFMIHCGPSGSETEQSFVPTQHELISAFSSGKIDRKSEVFVRFTAPLNSAVVEDPGQLDDLVEITPGINGEWRIINPQSVAFRPDGLWPAAENFTFQMLPEELVDSDLEVAGEFQFSVMTEQPRLSISLEALESTTLGKYKLSGRLESSDWLTFNEVKDLLSARINGLGVGVSWDDEGDQRVRRFQVENISRGEEASELILQLESSPQLKNNAWNRSLRIPAINEFALIDYRVNLGDPKGVILIFSDPINEAQDLQGLIQLVEYQGSYRMVRNRERVTVIPDEMHPGGHDLRILSSLKSDRGISLGQTQLITLFFDAAPPSLEWASKGSLLPVSADGQLSFSAINLKSVSMEIFRVKEQNMLDYLQDNAWGEDRYLTRVGYVVHREHIILDEAELIELNKPKRYTLDLSSWMDRDPNALYEMRLGFNKWDALTPCQWSEKEGSDTLDWPNEGAAMSSFWDYNYYGLDGYYDGFEWEDRDNPCKPAFYNRDRFIAQQIFPVSLGLMAKGNDEGQFWAVVAELETGAPASGARLKWYNFQKELIGTSDTDDDGFSTFKYSGQEPVFFVEAETGGTRTFLRLQEGESLSLSSFDVTGKRVSSNRDVYLYGERDVWRPGDSIYIFAVVRGEQQGGTRKPPVRYRFRDPSGKIVSQGNLSSPQGNIIPIFLKTMAEDRTGNWSVQVAIGDEVYSRQIAVEAIKPNRFTFTWADPDKPVYDWRDSRHELSLKWLYGAPAKGVPVTAELRNSRLLKPFENLKEYQFHDLSERWDDPNVVWAEGTTGNNGSITLVKTSGAGMAKGPALSKWTIRATEPGGGFSVDQITRKLFPFSSYAGVRVQTDQDGFPRATIGSDNPVDLVKVDASGNGMSGDLQVAIDKVSWRWWWDNDEGSDWNYSSREVLEPVRNILVKTDGSGKVRMSFNPSDWGRYRIKVFDLQSGHCAASYIYAGSPDFEDLDRSEAARISFELDKEEYHPGEQVAIELPSVFRGAALTSIENGSGVIHRFWTPVKPGGNRISFSVTEAMVPSAYVSVMLIQAMATVELQAPFRMYGIQPFRVTGKDSRLNIVAEIPDELRSAQDVTIKVSEKTGREMDYTIAVVDEGLLQLTRFVTPDPWQYFHEKEALGIKTWDMYDELILSTQGIPDRLIAIGGDGALLRPDEKESANRFPPIVKVLGPFHLGKGKKGTHSLSLPPYMGAVRVMVVGAGDQAWGSLEKSVPVKDPVMLFSSAPRVLTPGDDLKFPMTIISTMEGANEIEWQLKDLNGGIKFSDASTGKVRIDGPGEHTVYVPVTVTGDQGAVKVEMTAKGKGGAISDVVQIPVRDPLPFKTTVATYTIPPGEAVNIPYTPLGDARSASGVLELMGIAPVSVDDKMDYLLRYPHGCLEQTVSQAFAELYLPEFSRLTDEQSRARNEYISSAITKITGFATGAGAFASWPGSDHVHIWSDIYAAHFLKEASGMGYRVPQQLLSDWEKRARRLAVSWTPGGIGEGQVLRSSELEQAYRLYVLTQLGSPELGAMNILREEKGMSRQALYFLAAAYADLGQNEEADRIMAKARKTTGNKYDPENYGSELRELAIALLSYVGRKDETEAFRMASELGAAFQRARYFNTQEAGFTLLALAKYYQGFSTDAEMKLQINANGKDWVRNSQFQTEKIILESPALTQEIMIKNMGARPVFAFLKRTGKEVQLFDAPGSEGLSLDVRYAGLDGSPLTITSLVSATEFEAFVSLKKTGNPWQGRAKDLALTFMLPAGWEFLDREATSIHKGGVELNYIDQRDDKVSLYFDLTGQEASFRIRLRAAYPGLYYSPPCWAEMMYDPSVYAHSAGYRIKVAE